MSSPDIRGNTLRVYLYALKNGPCKLRDIQHDLGFSTPSLASYHLNKLVEAGYVRQDADGRYSSVKDASGEILEGYTNLGVAVVPRLFFLALFFSIVIAYFAYRTLTAPGYTVYLAAASLGVVATLWVETVRLWRRLVTWT
ncbi:MAG: helix-turn-helix transcriptional regulator [Nitrososphaerota archaeon]|nr:helix-turn-helix transcriptional regulator [Nitrososphaerota archaeon]MDG6939584.1 helix-turn-helix transcriptional regulator [Nitrososphaerota archaeon]